MKNTRKIFLDKLRFGHAFLLLTIATVALVIYLSVSGYFFFREAFPDVAVLRTQFPEVHYRGKELTPLVKIVKNRPNSWVSLNQISNGALGAVVVSEDWAFFQHKGYDANQIKEAIKEDVEDGKFSRGASTITQQVVKNVFLERDKNIWRKVKELILAVQIEKALKKRKILEIYFNIAEWGEGIFGINQAARFYFKKSASELNPKEGAFLAMLLPSPKRYSQSYRRRELTRYAKRTVVSILRKMTQAQYLTETERDFWIAEPLSFERPIEPILEKQALEKSETGAQSVNAPNLLSAPEPEPEGESEGDSEP